MALNLGHTIPKGVKNGTSSSLANPCTKGVVLGRYSKVKSSTQPKQVKFTNCNQFLSHNFFKLRFSF